MRMVTLIVNVMFEVLMEVVAFHEFCVLQWKFCICLCVH